MPYAKNRNRDADGTLPATAPPLRSRFPLLGELRVELEFAAESGWDPSHQVHILHPPAQARFLYICPFPGCTGRFDLEAPIIALLERSDPRLAAEVICVGTRPRNAGTQKPCGVRMSYRVIARYATSAAAEDMARQSHKTRGAAEPWKARSEK